ncbi:glyoxalase [Sphingomonas oleivorans]|uniref:Glyoxalase n=1 Tax=Sphingomonas oleivorans TaxID=1735121 RepID=A0A2T5FZD1_9SPHN|nr:VOC family protein [Sphingomonas oleivorans]PTQ12053.1 glyoxalase [Sphingomonas oleivorans]
MRQSLSLTAVLVIDYDDAIAFYTNMLGFELREDTRLSAEKRWVVVAPPGSDGSAILLAKAANARQARAVGDQSGGRVFLFLQTDDFERDYAAYTERGVRFVEQPRTESYGTVAVFEDLYGNRWDLIESAAGLIPSKKIAIQKNVRFEA